MQVRSQINTDNGRLTHEGQPARKVRASTEQDTTSSLPRITTIIVMHINFRIKLKVNMNESL